MYIVFTKPNKFTKTYTEAYQIADEWYNNTGEIVAVEKSELSADYSHLLYTNSPYFPSYLYLNYVKSYRTRCESDFFTPIKYQQSL